MNTIQKQKVNLLPGSKGWITKYADLIQKNKIDISIQKPEGIGLEEFIHAALGKTGVCFGYPTTLLFGKNLDDSKWTTEEKLKLLLFEAHIFIYQLHYPKDPFQPKEFTDKLLAFYGNHEARSISKLFTFFLKETEEEKLESILADRVDIKLNLLDTKIWISSINNVFIYLDVILFHEFLNEKKKSAIYHYDDLALNALNAIAMASSSDGLIESKERAIFKVFLASANISDAHRAVAEKRFEKGGGFGDFSAKIKKNNLGKHFLLDLSALVIFSNHDAVSEERQFLLDLALYFNLSEADLNESLALTEQFILQNHERVPLLSNSSSVEKLYGSFSKRWIKILGRNKDKLAKELKQSKELVSLIRKSTTTELTKEEKETVKEQFKDIVKSMPSLAIFLLPGGALLLPLVLKIIPDLVPSAFKDNALDD